MAFLLVCFWFEVLIAQGISSFYQLLSILRFQYYLLDFLHDPCYVDVRPRPGPFCTN